MQRLVYSPSIKAWVKSDSGVIDLTPYITGCRIDRKVNAKSTAQLEFRNPKVMQGDKSRFLFTQHLKDDGTVGPLFHPMDPVTIVFERIAGKPIQVFTGYCDAVPYVQLFPGLARLTASCTLKRLDYTYWDPGLPFVADFMKNYGWALGGDGGVKKGTGEMTAADKRRQAEAKNDQAKIIQSTNINDSSIGNLVYAVLNEIGGWDPSNIYIQPLPSNINDIVTNLFEEFTKENKSQIDEVQKLLRDIVGYGQYGTSAASGGNQNVEGGGSGNVNSPGDVSGTEIFETVRIASWIVPILKYARGKGWNGSINSGFRSFQEQQVLWNNRANNPNPVARPGTSNHEGSKWPKGAVDVNDHETLNNILLSSPYKNQLIWFGPGDPVHFSGDGH